ncbi:MAG: glycoside hydrolase family 2 [Chlorobi bacterium]|nr:glycoside hydrolase family 2 [Chlorobiota bacterium]
MNTRSWFEGVVPGTVLHSLVEDSIYTDIYKDDNLAKIPVGPFKSSWWYRTDFNLEKVQQGTLLKFEGINYKANIWLNGKLIADTTEVINSFRQFRFDVSEYVREGNNVLAVEVFPPVAGDFTLGFVDWNPEPPDKNMGIFRNVILEVNGGVSVISPYVISDVSEDHSRASLRASVYIVNNSDARKKGGAVMIFNGAEMIVPVTLDPGQTKQVLFTPEVFEALKIKNPSLWWPHTLGEPYLYNAKFEFREGGIILDGREVSFGVRTVSDYFTKDGHRGFKINGKKILIRGGGWVDRLLLDDTYETTKAQLEYVKDMNLNTIRLEGFWGKDQSIYKLCDEMGILVMVGWSCQWEWENYLGKYCDEEYGGILSDSDIAMMSDAWQDQIVWLRNHPSIFTWMGGSDCKPKPKLEKNYFKIFEEYDSTRVYLPSAKEWASLAGETGVKMRGPYAYEPPVYWFADTLYGGAFGFNTETGPGAQVPPLESIKKMLSENHLWPIDEMWEYHCGRNEFNTLDRYTKALEMRYGKPECVEDYVKKAQVLNYELMRPMFEAFSAYRYRATGVIQWMLNSAWPEMYWQLYDFYLMPNGAYFGAKKAQQPYHIIYDYAQNCLFAVNDRLEDKNGCKLKVRIYDINSELKFEKDLSVDLKANESDKVLDLPHEKYSSVYFIDTRLYDKDGKEIDNNFYWLSSKDDVLDYDADVQPWYYHTPSKQYADFTALNKMPEVSLVYSLEQERGEDADIFIVKLENNSNHIAFFVHASIVDARNNKTILPVIWSDNYVSVLPGETRIIKARIKDPEVNDKMPRLIIDGYNLKKH